MFKRVDGKVVFRSRFLVYSLPSFIFSLVDCFAFYSFYKTQELKDLDLCVRVVRLSE